MGIFNNSKQTVSKIPSKATQDEVNNGDDDKYMTGHTFLHSNTINKLINPNTPIYYAQCAHDNYDRLKFYPGDNSNVKATIGFARLILNNEYLWIKEAGVYHITYVDNFKNISEDKLSFIFEYGGVDLGFGHGDNIIYKHIPHTKDWETHSYDITIYVKKDTRFTIISGGHTIMDGTLHSRLIIYRISEFPKLMTSIT